MFLKSNDPILDAQSHSQDYNPVDRVLGIAALGTAAYQAHQYALRNSSTYARKLYKYASAFEELTPYGIGRTLGLADRFSSHLINDVHITPDRLSYNGGLSRLGQHFERLLGRDVYDQVSQGGLHFDRVAKGDPYLALRGHPETTVRFVQKGRLGDSSFRYGAELNAGRLDLDFTGEWWKPRRLLNNFKQLRNSQIPRGYKSNVRAVNEAAGFAAEVQPYLAKIGQPFNADFAGVSATLPDYLRSVKARTSRFLFELAERPQRLLADVGFGLRAGTYNKLLHVPFVGHGGIVNNLLVKRVLPVAVGATVLRYADYLTGHIFSNALVGLPLKANTLRADVTDMLPGARSVTDFYADVVPGPQYGPLALPVGGAFAGALYHYGKVLKSAQAGAYIGEKARAEGARILPEVVGGIRGLLKEPSRLAEVFKAKGAYPGKGLLIGVAAMLPFLPGMIGSRRTGRETRDIYSGKTPVPVKSGRWWDLGTSPYEGGRIKEYRPHWYNLFKNRAQIRSLYGSEKEYWAHNPFLHPFRFLREPYYLEKRHFLDRPYPVTSPAFSNVPLVGPLLAATIGKLVKPPIRMHQAEFSGDDYSLYSTRLEPGDRGLPPPKPRAEFGLGHALTAELRQFEEFIGLPGFMFHTFREKVLPDKVGQDVFFQGSRQMDSLSRQYYERELGAGMGPKMGDTELFGYSEPLRRFIQREEGINQANEIPNTMPSWMPGDDYFVNFRVGDPYVKVAEGYARLPGEGYAALHPNLEGVNPEDYPDITKLSILGDVAPYSRQFASLRARLDRSSRSDTDMRIEYDQIVDRVERMKASVIQADERRFTGKTEEISGTIAKASLGGIELAEYPGRVFHLSSVGYSAADLSALTLGEENASRAAMAKAVDQKRAQLQDFFQENLQPGTKVSVTTPYGSVEHSEDIRAVVEAGGTNINRALIANNLALYRKDMGGAEAAGMHSAFGRAIGALGESLSFTGEEGAFNPLRYVPTPGHTKFWQERTALSQYIQQEVVGTKMRRWDRPIHDFMGPYFRGMVRRLTGDKLIPPDVRHRRELNTLTDMLSYLRDLQDAARNPGQAGRYTNQAHRTAVGANLFSSPVFVASTLPDRDATYFRHFVRETDPEKRQEILAIAPPEMARALKAQWAAQDTRIAMASQGDAPPIGEGGRMFTREGLDAYSQAHTRLDYGDYMRSREIAQFFDETGFRMPEVDSSVWDDVIDYDDVKLKILQYEGYDMHDFNIFEDRAALLWRKPWLDGAVRELTSGRTKSVENLRQSVERMMLAAGDKNPNARTTGSASHRAMGNVRVDVEIDDDAELLRDIRRNPESFDAQ